MISQRAVISGYNAMLDVVRASKNENTVNLYTCENKECVNTVKTIDNDPGKTPLVLDCLKCKGKMKSHFYTDIPEEPQVTMEFYRPELNTVLKKRSNEAYINHVLDGGLLLKDVEVATIKNPLEVALDTLRELKFRDMPTYEKFFEVFVPKLKENLGLENESKVIKLEKDGK